MWTTTSSSVDDVWGRIGCPQGLRLSHSALPGSSTHENSLWPAQKPDIHWFHNPYYDD